MKNDNVFEISSTILDNPRFNKIKSQFNDTEETKKFFESLIIEIKQPTTPNSENIRNLSEGELGKIILSKIEKFLNDKKVFILDHHNVEEYKAENIVLLNPHLNLLHIQFQLLVLFHRAQVV